MLEQLRNINLDRLDIDRAVELATVGKQVAATYTEFKVPVPGWLNDALTKLHGEITRRRADMLAARRNEINASLAALRTRDERVNDLQAELAKLNDELGAPKQP